MRKLKREREEEKDASVLKSTELEKKRKTIEELNEAVSETAELKSKLTQSQQQVESLQQGMERIEEKYRSACKEVQIHRDELIAFE